MYVSIGENDHHLSPVPEQLKPSALFEPICDTSVGKLNNPTSSPVLSRSVDVVKTTVEAWIVSRNPIYRDK